MAGTPSHLDRLIFGVRDVEDESSELPARIALRFMGNGVTVTDDPVTKATVIDIPGTVAAVDSVTAVPPLENTGTAADPVLQLTGVITDANHGNRAGGTLHPVATGALAGFMSATDKVKLDSLSPGGVSSVERGDAFSPSFVNPTTGVTKIFWDPISDLTMNDFGFTACAGMTREDTITIQAIANDVLISSLAGQVVITGPNAVSLDSSAVVNLGTAFAQRVNVGPLAYVLAADGAFDGADLHPDETIHNFAGGAFAAVTNTRHLVDASGGAVPISLPAATAATLNHRIMLINYSTSTTPCTVTPNGGDLIFDGGVTGASHIFGREAGHIVMYRCVATGIWAIDWQHSASKPSGGVALLVDASTAVAAWLPLISRTIHNDRPSPRTVKLIAHAAIETSASGTIAQFRLTANGGPLTPRNSVSIQPGVTVKGTACVSGVITIPALTSWSIALEWYRGGAGTVSCRPATLPDEESAQLTATEI